MPIPSVRAHLDSASTSCAKAHGLSKYTNLQPTRETKAIDDLANAVYALICAVEAIHLHIAPPTD